MAARSLCRQCLASERGLFDTLLSAPSRCARTYPPRGEGPSQRTNFIPSQQVRQFHPSSSRRFPSTPSKRPGRRDHRPKSDETTQTDFGELDVLRNTAVPATAIDACTSDGFALNNDVKLSGCGILLIGGEVFRWRPWLKEGRKEDTIAEGGTGEDRMAGTLRNLRGQWEIQKEAWGVLDLVWPKPDLLIIGTGPSVLPISPVTRKHLNEMGIRLEIQDTRNAAAQFNLLATERGVQQVAAALIPIGWKESKQLL